MGGAVFTNALSDVKVLRSLPDGALHALEMKAEKRHFHAGEVIVQQGSTADECFVVLGGQVTISRRVGGDRFAKRVLATLGPGEMFGEIAVLGNLKRTADAIAVTSCECLVIAKPALVSLVEVHHRFALSVLNLAVSRLSDLQLADQGQPSIWL